MDTLIRKKPGKMEIRTVEQRAEMERVVHDGDHSEHYEHDYEARHETILPV